VRLRSSPLRLGSLLLRLSTRLLEAALLLWLIVLLNLRLPLLLEVALLLLRRSLLLEVTLLLRLIMLLEVTLLLRLRATHCVGTARAIDLRPVCRSSCTKTGSCGGRMFKGSLRWMPLVLIEELLPVLSSLLVKLPLLRHWTRVPFAHRRGLCQGGP